MTFPHRRDFLKQSAAMLALGTEPSAGEQVQPSRQPEAGEVFSTFQARRRQELWSLLGDLPWAHKPAPAKLAHVCTLGGGNLLKKKNRAFRCVTRPPSRALLGGPDQEP